MQMLNFGKIPTLLLLLQLISINAQLNYPNSVSEKTTTPDVSPSEPSSSPVTNAKTVVTIVAKLGFFRRKDSKGDFQIGKFFAKLDSGEYYLTDKCCDIFKEPAQSSVENNWKEYRCSDVNFEIVVNYVNDVEILLETNLQFTYIGKEKFNNWTIYDKFWKNIVKASFLQVYRKNNFGSIDINVKVQTITPDVPSNKPSSSPVTNAKTVLTIHVFSFHARMNKSIFDVLKSPCFFSNKSGGYRELSRCCMLFQQLIKEVVKNFSKQSECVDVESIPFNDNVNATTVKKVSKFDFAYQELVELNSDRLTKSLNELSKEKDFQNMLRFNNISKVEYVALVQTIRHAIPSKKLTSSPVTKAKTVVTIDIQPVFIRPKDPNGNVQKREFYAQSNLGVYYSTNKCCDVFKEFAQMSVPKDWENYVCTDVSDKILPLKGNKAILKVWSTLAFKYADERRLNNLTIAKNFTSNVRKGLNSTGVLLKNSFRGIKTKASVTHI
ncbi:Egg protein [Schistosoma japonicum]|nr:Egg protein [Schistosoma japonicum]